MAKDHPKWQSLLMNYFSHLLKAYEDSRKNVTKTFKPLRLSVPKEFSFREWKLQLSEFSKTSGIQFEEQPKKLKYLTRFHKSKPDDIPSDVPICGDQGVLKALDHEDISDFLLVKYKSICIDITKSKDRLREHGFHLRKDGRLMFLIKKRRLILEEEPRSLSEEHALEQAAHLRGIQTPPSSQKAFSHSSPPYKTPSPEAVNIFPLGSPHSLGGSDPSSQLSYHHKMFFSPQENETPTIVLPSSNPSQDNNNPTTTSPLNLNPSQNQSPNPQNLNPTQSTPQTPIPTPRSYNTQNTTPTRSRRFSQRAATIALNKEAKVKQNIARKLLSPRENHERVTRASADAKALLETEGPSSSQKMDPNEWPPPPPSRKRRQEVGFGARV